MGYEKRFILRLRELEWNWAVEAEVCYISSRLKYDCHEQAMIPLQKKITRIQDTNLLFSLYLFSLFLLHAISFDLWLLAITYENSIAQASAPPTPPTETNLCETAPALPWSCPAPPDSIHPCLVDYELLRRLGEKKVSSKCKINLPCLFSNLSAALELMMSFLHSF